MSNEALINSGLVTVKDAASFLSLSRAMIYKLMETGHLRYVKIGRSRRIPKLALSHLATDGLMGGWKV